MKNKPVTIIAGPCSIDESNLNEIYEIGDISIVNRNGVKQKAITGTRIVGLKSRTELDISGKGMGMDYEAYQKNLHILMKGGKIGDFEILPSAVIASKIVKDTGMMIATEVMCPIIQLPSFEKYIPANMFLPWNPAVNQLGWQIEQMAIFARRNNWQVGIKNGKWIGEHLHLADHPDFKGRTTMEKTWSGLVNYVANNKDRVILIHRGVDTPGKGDFRNALVHNLAKRVKRETGAKMFFDPSHSYGPKLRSHIVGAVVEAMKITISPNEYLYDGILIEVGTSITDTGQHISVSELKQLVSVLSGCRDLAVPPGTKQKMKK